VHKNIFCFIFFLDFYHELTQFMTVWCLVYNNLRYDKAIMQGLRYYRRWHRYSQHCIICFCEWVCMCMCVDFVCVPSPYSFASLERSRSWTITFRAESFKLPKAFADFIRLLFQRIHKTLMHYTFGLGRCLRFSLCIKYYFLHFYRVGNSSISDVYVTAAR